MKLQVDCYFFFSFFPFSVFSPLASPPSTSLIVSLWLIWNDKASGVTYVCYRLLCRGMTCDCPPPANYSVGWTVLNDTHLRKTRWGHLLRDALGRYFAAHLLGNAPQKIASVTPDSDVTLLGRRIGFDGFRGLSIRVRPSGRWGGVWRFINPTAVLWLSVVQTHQDEKNVLFLKKRKRVDWFFTQIPTSNKLFIVYQENLHS